MAISDLKVLMNRHERATLKEFYKKGEVGPPMWLIEDDCGNRIVVMTALDSSEEMAKAARQSLKGLRAVRYAFVMEAWFVTDREGAGLDNMRPSENPLRREGVWFSAEDKDGNRLVRHYEIHRREGAKPWLEKMEVGDDPYASTGRFFDMFSEGPYT